MKYILYFSCYECGCHGFSVDTDSGGRHTDDEAGYTSHNHSPTSVKEHAGSDGSGDESKKPISATKPVDKHSDDEEEENAIPFINDESPKSDVVMKEELPPYLPAVQGCRSVEEFQCLNRYILNACCEVQLDSVSKYECLLVVVHCIFILEVEGCYFCAGMYC
jgi:hypothetical protein